ncbi:MAG TPA: DNRLRE domain-containing protein [Solirubrobacteraceae bacterium]|nr:DNRLRE domain-containing protein [Solirubrobacteraceae bacterium]
MVCVGSTGSRRKVRPSGGTVSWRCAWVSVVVVLALVVAPGASADLQTFGAVADSYVSSAAPLSNYGSATRFWVQGATPVMRTYVRFDVEVPAGATITGATLQLYAGSGSTLVGVQAYAVGDTSWGEDTITDANAPALGTLLGSSRGWSTSGYKTVGLPDGYIHGGLNSIGLGTSAASGKAFFSREAGSNPPTLVVNYRLASYPLRGVFDRDLSSTGFSDEAAAGFDLIDSSPATVDDLAGGLKGMVWVGNYNNATCSWSVSDATLQGYVAAHKGDPKVGVWLISDEPNPVMCPTAPAQHKARTDLIHSVDPTAKVLVVLDGNSGQASRDQLPDWVGTADAFGLDPFTCYQGQSSCVLSWIDTLAASADRVGLPYWGVVQAFGNPSGSGASYTSLDSSGLKVTGDARLPTADELHEEFVHWRATRMLSYLVFAWRQPAATPSLWLANQPALVSQLTIENAAGMPDTSAPSTPTGLAVTGATPTSIAVSWTGSSDDVGVAGYGVYLNGALVDTTTNTTYTFSGLTCGTSYELAVDAFDAAGNRSVQASMTASTSPCPTSDPVITAAGDIAGSPTDSAPTAALIQEIAPTRVLTLGDNAYPDGSLQNFRDYYDPNWGRFKAITSPSPGNHDYHIADAAGYFTYFGAQAPAAYYSYDLGAWHLISLDGEISHSAGSPQEQWLKADLAAHPNQCTLAYWHEPRFSSGSVHGSNTSFDAFWRDLFSTGAEVVLNGHDHDYERFAPQTPDAQADPARGIREFVVGTGGDSLYSFGAPLPNSEVRNNSTDGVLELTLHNGSYDWRFAPVAGQSFTDSGTQACH